MTPLGLTITPIEALGYGTFGKCLRLGLEQIGVDLVMPAPDRIHEIPRTGATVWALPASQMYRAYEGQYVAGYTMWEATRLPESFRDSFHNFDALYVPCEQNRELFSRYHDNVHKVPLGFNADVWTPQPREVNGEFRILCAGAGLSIEGGRKGFDLAVEAFQKAFPDWKNLDPQPKLVTKSLRPQNAPAWVDQVVASFSEDELVRFVWGCHAYLGPSKGEGWGYWPQQALATGMPVVMSAIPAHMEYAHIPGIFTAPVQEVPADYFVYGPAGNWWKADTDVLASHLRAIYENYDAAHELAQAGAKEMHVEFSHTAMASRVMDLIEPHMKGSVGSDLWEFTRQMFPARVVRNVDCTIGDTHLVLTPGEDYMLSADQLRVLHDSGAITDECLSDGPGVLI